MKRIANKVALQTIGYNFHGAQRVKIGFYNYYKVTDSDYNNYEKGFTEILYEGEWSKMDASKGWRSAAVNFLQTKAIQNPKTNLIETVMIIGLDRLDSF